MVWLARTLLVAIATAAATAALGQEFRTFSLMSWNVENLFDAADDPANPFDDTFLPKGVKDTPPGHAAHCQQVNPIPAFARECSEIDWTDEKLARKLQAIADVIRAVRLQTDVIILPELENPGILARLNAEFLAGLGYTTAIEPDTSVTDLDRGIDVGILSRLPSASPPTAHKVDFGNDAKLCRATRDIVAAPLTLPDGRTLHLYAVHFPSGGNPIECRERAMRTLNALSAALPAYPGVVAVMARRSRAERVPACDAWPIR
jgi:hypothetical protein